MRVLTSIQLKNKRKQSIALELDGEPWIEADAEVVVRFDLKKDMELTAAQVAEVEQENEFVKARRRAVNWSVKQPRTEREAHAYLARLRTKPGIVERVLEELRRQQLIRDEEVAERGTRKARRSGIGPRRARMELAARGVGDDLAENAIEPLRDPEYQRSEVEALASKRLKRLRDAPPLEKRRKVGDYLMRRGFDPDIVYETINRIIGESADEN